MSARPATIYLGTRSHFRRQKRSESSSVRSFSAAIRRKFHNNAAASTASTPSCNNKTNKGRHVSTSSSVRGKLYKRKLLANAERRKIAAAAATNTTSISRGEKPIGSTAVKSSGEAVTMTSVMHLPITTSNVTTGPSTSTASSSSTTTTSNTSTSQTTATPGLPSPSGSASETSDYQRSTPSPRYEHDSGTGSMEDWSSDQQSKSHQRDPDPGLGDDCGSTTASAKGLCKRSSHRSNSDLVVVPPLLNKSSSRRKSTSSLVCHCEEDSTGTNSIKISPSKRNIVLQHLRVALEKIPDAALAASTIKSSSSPDDDDGCDNKKVGTKRPKNCANTDLEQTEKGAKKAKKEAKERKPPVPLSGSHGFFKGQGKITEYLAEMKQYNAMRKEKLDRVLNLIKTEPNILTYTNIKSDDTLTLLPVIQSSPAAVIKDEDISKKGGLDDKQSESGIETSGSKDDTSSVASSSCRHSISSSTSRDEDIFEVPRTIRFPPAAPTKCYSEVVICKWELCGVEFDSTGKLLDHLKTVHASAEMQKNNEDEDDSGEESTGQYKCLWEGCKVYGKGSCSKSWLEKHVMNHGGNKPFQCIVDGCKQRFGTQSLLERHVNGHFKFSGPSSGNAMSNSNTSGSHGGNSGTSSGTTSRADPNNPYHYLSSSNKVIRKLVNANGRKVKYRKTIYSARIFDLFDLGSMAQVKYRLSQYENRCQEWKANGQLASSHHDANQEVIFRSKIVARKTDPDGNVKVLQQWSPENILEDEWTLLKDAVPSKRVKLSSLPVKSRELLSSQLIGYPNNKCAEDAKKRGRKNWPQPRSTALS